MNTFFLYILCGGTATIFDWGCFYIVNSIYNINYLYAITLSFILGSSVSFISNKFITFNNRFSNYSFQYLIFLAGAISSLLFTYIQMIFFVNVIKIVPFHARIFITFIMLFYNYYFNKIITFGMMK